MPADYVKSLSDKHNIPITELEKYWKEAKSAAKESYKEEDDKFWGTVTMIFKNKINKKFNLNEMLTFKEYTLKESFEGETLLIEEIQQLDEMLPAVVGKLAMQWAGLKLFSKVKEFTARQLKGWLQRELERIVKNAKDLAADVAYTPEVYDVLISKIKVIGKKLKLKPKSMDWVWIATAAIASQMDLPKGLKDFNNVQEGKFKGMDWYTAMRTKLSSITGKERAISHKPTKDQKLSKGQIDILNKILFKDAFKGMNVDTLLKNIELQDYDEEDKDYDTDEYDEYGNLI